jgi:hypothetical protein
VCLLYKHAEKIRVEWSVGFSWGFWGVSFFFLDIIFFILQFSGILKSRIRNIKTKVRTIYPSVFRKTEVQNELERLHEEFVWVPAEKACNIVFVFSSLYLK